MPRLVAFLRAINVGGHVVTMDVLRRQFTSLGFTGVETFIASGNVVFTTTSKSIPPLVRRIETSLHETLGYEVKTFLRTDREVAAIARYKPFKEQAMQTAASLNVAFLAAPLTAVTTKSLLGLRGANDDLHVHGTEVYWLCKTRQMESTVSNAVIEKTLKAPATLRGLRTVAKLVAKFGF